MAVLNYAGRTIREETMYNKELMGRDRGGVSQEPKRGREAGRPPISMGVTHLYQEVTTGGKHRCETVSDPLGPQTGGLPVTTSLSIQEKHSLPMTFMWMR